MFLGIKKENPVKRNKRQFKSIHKRSILLGFFWESIKFPQHNIHQSETRVSDKKLSIKVYIKTKTLGEKTCDLTVALN